jgi:hypothetical protein
VLEQGFLILNVAFGLQEPCKICVLLDEKKKLIFLDYIAVFEKYAVKIAFHAGAELDGVDGLGIAA